MCSIEKMIWKQFHERYKYTILLECAKTFAMKTQVGLLNCIHYKTCTVKQGYSEHTYNELMLTVKQFLFPLTLLHIVKLTDK